MNPFVDSQAHLLKATENNPLPTAVPPPIAANAGTLGVRHVLCVIGLPERGKPYIARRLQAYLSFFHGAEVHIFNLQDYERGKAGCDENADALLGDLRQFMYKENAAAGHNMDVAKSQKDISDPSSTEADTFLVADKDTRRKNVDSGKVAIIMSTDSHASFKEKWSGTSKERRQWAAATLAQERKMNAKLIYIEVIVNQPALIEANIRAKRRALGQGETSHTALREHNTKVKLYSRMYVTLQDDGSEDDLSYIKLYNYGGKVVTNRMHGYLRMRIAQFLTTVHTTPHVIYLSRHGQSEYNVLGKIGGNPPLCESGKEYAERLGAWVPSHICATPEGQPLKTRLWTSSLQRTILTAEHIPHPIIPSWSFDNSFYDSECADAAPAGAPGEGSPGQTHAGAPPSALTNGHVSAGPSPKRTGVGAQEADSPAPFAPTPTSGGASTLPPEMTLNPTLPGPSRSSSYGNPELRQAYLSSGSSPPPELQDADTDGVWEQMSPRVYRNLDEIFAGEYEGMRYEDIKRLRPDEASLRAMDKIGYRYPRGESYFDILSRLDPLVHEMESYREPLLIVSHQAVRSRPSRPRSCCAMLCHAHVALGRARSRLPVCLICALTDCPLPRVLQVLRVLYAYLMGKSRTSAPKIEIPLHTVMKITYDGWNPPKEERFFLGPEPQEIIPDVPPEPNAPKDYDGQKDF